MPSITGKLRGTPRKKMLFGVVSPGIRRQIPFIVRISPGRERQRVADPLAPVGVRGVASRTIIDNRLLQSLAPADLARLRPHLSTIELRPRLLLQRPNRPIEFVCFPNSGMVSVMAEVMSDKGIEIGVIGIEGMTGLPLLMDDDRSPNSSIVQLAGRGLTIRADVFGKILWESPGMHKVFLRFAKSFGVQTSQTALSNGRANISQRLARWLLMAHDRSRDGDLAVTHEMLAMALGVRRPGVTEKLQEFNSLGLVRSERGLLAIMDRTGLEDLAGAFYGEAEKDYNRLFPRAKISTPHVNDQKRPLEREAGNALIASVPAFISKCP